MRHRATPTDPILSASSHRGASRGSQGKMGSPAQGLRRMATAPSPTTRSRRPAQPDLAPPRWRRWLVLGLCFGLGHGMTQRLLALHWADDASRPPAFRATSPAEGTSLDELRRQHGESRQPLPADLDTLARQKREAQQKEEAAKREAAERQKAGLREEKDRLESERRRLEEFNRSPDAPELQPSGEAGTGGATPTAPELPPPVPSTTEPVPSAPAPSPGQPAPSLP